MSLREIRFYKRRCPVLGLLLDVLCQNLCGAERWLTFTGFPLGMRSGISH